MEPKTSWFMSHKQCISVSSGHKANCILFVCSEQQICVHLWKTKASLTSTDLVERSAQLDEWHGRERPLGIHLQVAGPEAVEIAHDNQKVGRCLHRQEPTPRNVHTCPITAYSHLPANDQSYHSHLPIKDQSHHSHLPINDLSFHSASLISYSKSTFHWLQMWRWYMSTSVSPAMEQGDFLKHNSSYG